MGNKTICNLEKRKRQSNDFDNHKISEKSDGKPVYSNNNYSLNKDSISMNTENKTTNKKDN